MKIKEVFRNATTKVRSVMGTLYRDDARTGVRGDVFMTLRDARTNEVQGHWEKRNLIVKDASILIARLMKDSQEPPKGCYVLAVGTGAPGWNVMSPPAPTNTQRALNSELTRKTFSTTSFVDSGGGTTIVPTNVVDFECTFTESEAVGPLVEMGIIGGNINTNLNIRNPVPTGTYDPNVDLTNYETLVNVLNFPVINKPATSTLTVVWRLSF